MSTRSSHPFSWFGPAAACVARGVRALNTVWERRRLIGQLGALDDHMLRDIGITRQDIVSSLAEPMFRDPTIRLAARALDAREARRAFALDVRSRPGEAEQPDLRRPIEAPVSQRAA